MTLTHLPLGLGGQIYRSPMPFSEFDRDQSAYDEFGKNGIRIVVVLVSEPECRARSGRDLLEQYKTDGLEVIHLPIADFGIPDDHEAFGRAITEAIAHAQADRNVAIHCLAGVGRTGLFSACLAREVLGLNGDDAIAWVRRFIPRAVETEAQRQFVNDRA